VSTRAFGAALLLLADFLFYGTLLFIYAFTRMHASAWPDVDAALRPPATLPLLAAGAAVLAALLHRARRPLPLSFAGTATALVILLLFWQGAAARGLMPGTGRYGAAVWGLTALWALHLFGGLVGTGAMILRKRTAPGTPLLGRYLAAQAAAGVLLAGMVFLW